MKKRAASLIILSICLAAFVVRAGEWNSVIITQTDSALALDVPEHHFVRIRNFTQEGGSERGVVTATANGGVSNTVVGATLIDTTSAPGSGAPAEPIKKVVVAGPAQITIAPVPGGTLFVTYRREAESTPTPTPTVTATPTPTATPTITPTPTVTPTPTPTP